MTTLDGQKSLIFLGDNHGSWYDLFYQLDKNNIDNAYIISVGDLGIGFKYQKEYEYFLCANLNEKFANRNIKFLGIRGNHDNKYFFTGENRVNLENFELLEDYTLCEYNSKLIQFIGGAVSIDRVGRKEGISYWPDEGAELKKEECKKVDILVTHTAPSFCFPQTFNDMVYGWAKEDSRLIEDLTNERALIDEIFAICRPELHLYGHFHSSWSETIAGCKHKLLNIDELWEYK